MLLSMVAGALKLIAKLANTLLTYLPAGASGGKYKIFCATPAQPACTRCHGLLRDAARTAATGAVTRCR